MTITDITFGTAAKGVTDYSTPAVKNGTRALSLRADYLRSNVDLQAGEVHSLHEETRELDLQDRALEKSKLSVSNLLEELSFVRGMGWSDIASIADVSVSAVRKWRQGGDASADRRRTLARAAAFLDLLEVKGLVQDPARWMEMYLPLEAGYLIRPLDLYLEGHTAALVDLVEERLTMEQVLDSVRPSWREQRSDYDIFEDTDGERSLRLRNR